MDSSSRFSDHLGQAVPVTVASSDVSETVLGLSDSFGSASRTHCVGSSGAFCSPPGESFSNLSPQVSFFQQTHRSWDREPCWTFSTFQAQGQEYSQLHINFLELKAVFLALLKGFEEMFFSRSVLIMSAISPMMAYFIHQEGTLSLLSLCQLTLDLLRWCRQSLILLSASHVAGDQILVADVLPI